MTERHDTANACQRARRARNPRIDYYPSGEALVALEAKRAPLRRGTVEATNSAVLDSILTEWAELAGIKKADLSNPMTAENTAGISRRQCAPAYDSGAELPPWAESWLAAGRARQAAQRVQCGASKHRDGKPCRALSEPGKRRCKWHGGCSTGPRTEEGKAKALANLKQNRRGAFADQT